MALHFPDEVPPEHIRTAMFARAFMGGGWNRFLPGRAVLITSFLAHQPMTRDDLHDLLREREQMPEGMADSVWEPLDPYTDEELADLAKDWGREPETAAQANAEDQQRRAEDIADMASYATALGLAPVETMDDLLAFMVAVRLVVAEDDGGQVRYDLNADAPLPEEVLPLTAERIAREGKIRWLQMYEPTAQDIIRQFRPDDADRPVALTTSLQKLSRRLGVDVETARAGVGVLMFEGDFTTSRDPETVPEHAVFEIRVDWQRFAKQRFGLRMGTDEDSD
ncbi:DUF6042 family protein [Catellatospora coxensis]|uniref:Uncharacterized protein n=1 Tax=Catellatospora coxensis TaxID=310354 RepID=A0A8J3P8G9_9ACTN|nr:DUF6042 family protein [Catellatospora coxensis]GIG05681.1 hypothetical protein Cco03nite_23810 [Catellatospora coxensis]